MSVAAAAAAAAIPELPIKKQIVSSYCMLPTNISRPYSQDTVKGCKDSANFARRNSTTCNGLQNPESVPQDSGLGLGRKLFNPSHLQFFILPEKNEFDAVACSKD